MHPRRRLLGLALLAPVLVGCSSTPRRRADDPGPPIAVSRPPGGASLRQLGFTNGPVDIVFLPTSTTLTRKVDQVNVTTAFGPGADGPTVLTFLRQTLPGNGWLLDQDSGGSLLFHNGGYDGAFTQSADLWALTVRKRRI